MTQAEIFYGVLMRYIINDNHNPYYNLALEEYLSKNFTREFFMLWQNSACIVVGRNQDTVSGINVDFVKSHDITVLRRLTGGGAAYHDLGNINYTFIVNDVEKNLFDFKKHTQTIIEVLHKLCVDAEFTGRNDLTINTFYFGLNPEQRRFFGAVPVFAILGMRGTKYVP